MLYFAVILVFIGILCLIYVSLYPGKLEIKSSQPSHREYPPLRESLFNAKYPDTRKDSWDERIRNERQQFYAPQQEDTLQEEPQVEERQPEIVESVETPDDTNDSVEVEVEFTLEGTLYLDRGRKIPFADKKLKDKVLTDEFAGLSREGFGLMTEDKGVFHFRSGNAVYSYAVNELEQVVFFDQGVVLIPFDQHLPAPLFLTENVSELKEFLLGKKHGSL